MQLAAGLGVGARLDLLDRPDADLFQGGVVEFATVVVSHGRIQPHDHQAVQLLTIPLVTPAEEERETLLAEETGSFRPPLVDIQNEVLGGSAAKAEQLVTVPVKYPPARAVQETGNNDTPCRPQRSPAAARASHPSWPRGCGSGGTTPSCRRRRASARAGSRNARIGRAHGVHRQEPLPERQVRVLEDGSRPNAELVAA